MDIPWTRWLVLTSLALPTLASVPTMRDDLPIAEWVESLSEVDRIELHYSGFTLDGAATYIDIYVGGPDHAHVRAGGAEKRQQFWISNGVLTTLLETSEGPPVVFRVDIERAREEPHAWFQGAKRTVLDAVDVGAELQVLIDLWPSTEDKGTYNVGISFGFGNLPVPFGWLDRFLRDRLTGERVDETFVVGLDGGARIVVDASNGLVREFAAASSDGEKGVMRRTGLELDPGFDEAMFVPVIPDGAEESDALEAKIAVTQQYWSLYRNVLMRTVLAASRTGKFELVAQLETLSAAFTSFHVRSSVPQIEPAAKKLEGNIDEHLDKLLGYLRANPDDPAVRKRFDEAWKELEDAVDEACQRAATNHAKAAVRAPFDSEDPLLEELLEIEREAAIAGVAAEFRRELRAHLDGRRAEIPDDGSFTRR